MGQEFLSYCKYWSRAADHRGNAATVFWEVPAYVTKTITHSERDSRGARTIALQPSIDDVVLIIQTEVTQIDQSPRVQLEAELQILLKSPGPSHD